MPHAYNVHLSTRINFGMSKQLSTIGFFAECNLTKASKWKNLSVIRRNLSPVVVRSCSSIQQHLFQQTRTFTQSLRMSKAQELPFLFPEGQEDQNRSNFNLKRASSSEEVAFSVPKINCPAENSEDAIKGFVSSLRNWDLTELGVRQARHQQPGMELTVLSYNVLAQCLLDENFYLYRRSQQENLVWDYRKVRLLNELTQLAADVVCLQEVENQHFDDFYQPELNKLGYLGVYKKRTGNKNDGCAIFFKKDKFRLQGLTVVEYCKPEVLLLDRDNVALVAMLQPVVGGRPFRGHLCVANTHLLFNPGRGDIKLAQLKILLAEIDKLAFRRFSSTKRPLYHPVILCGDFNSEPHCYLYRFLSRGSLHYEGLTAGDISGQSEGSHRGRFPLVRDVFPSSLGISDRCQYLETIRRRNGVGEREKAAAAVAAAADGEDVDIRQSTGKISHRLNLVSAYKHWVHRANVFQPEVTTNQNRTGCTVDYIFYSVQYKRSVIQQHQVVHKDVRENSLSLLGTYNLLTNSDLQHIGQLPNAALPSDHLPLMAKFLFQDSEL